MMEEDGMLDNDGEDGDVERKDNNKKKRCP